MNTHFSRPKSPYSKRLRLFCFPYAGGSSAVFRNWAALLPDSIDVFPVEIPGRRGKDNDVQFDSLVNCLLRRIDDYLDLPFAIFGHSMGALIGFEITRTMMEHYGIAPLHLIVSARQAPHEIQKRPNLHMMPDRILVNKLHELGGTSEDILGNESFLRAYLPILRSDLKVIEEYQYEPGPILSCPISVIGGRDDDSTTYESLVSWAKQTDSIFTLRIFPGNHFFINTYQGQVLNYISNLLAENPY